MSANWGHNIELSLFGESHGDAIGVVMGNLEAGIKIDMDEVNRHMQRRVPGKKRYTTNRQESDEIRIVSGLLDGYTTGAPLCAMIPNMNQHSADYEILKTCMRPSHSDYPAYIKYHGFNDVRGGGHFSGRLSAPLVFAGSIARQILQQKNIVIGGHILSIHHLKDDCFDVVSEELLNDLTYQSFPLLNHTQENKMIDCIYHARSLKDSVGGVIECAILNVPVGVGRPFFDSLESHLSSLLFSIPGVKSVCFGNDHITELYGSEANDAYYYEDGNVKTFSNHNGGIVGGLSTGMPIIVKVGMKPTPSIGVSQNTINVQTQENVHLELKGRHDPCIVPRAVVVVESMLALGLLDIL